jgi:type IV secretory pathway VirB6-like protein
MAVLVFMLLIIIPVLPVSLPLFLFLFLFEIFRSYDRNGLESLVRNAIGPMIKTLES